MRWLRRDLAERAGRREQAQAVKHTSFYSGQVGGGDAAVIVRHDLAFWEKRQKQGSGRALAPKDKTRGFGVAGSETAQTVPVRQSG